MAVKLQSTRATVRDPQKVQEVLDSYGLRGVEIELSKQGEGWGLEMTFEDETPDWGWGDEPAALHRSHWPTEEEVPDEDDAYELLNDLYDERGPRGFLSYCAPWRPTSKRRCWSCARAGRAAGAPRPAPGASSREPASRRWK